MSRTSRHPAVVGHRQKQRHEEMDNEEEGGGRDGGGRGRWDTQRTGAKILQQA